MIELKVAWRSPEHLGLDFWNRWFLKYKVLLIQSFMCASRPFSTSIRGKIIYAVFFIVRASWTEWCFTVIIIYFNTNEDLLFIYLGRILCLGNGCVCVLRKCIRWDRAPMRRAIFLFIYRCSRIPHPLCCHFIRHIYTDNRCLKPWTYLYP